MSKGGTSFSNQQLPQFRLPINLDNYSYNLDQFNKFKQYASGIEVEDINNDDYSTYQKIFSSNDFQPITSTFEKLTYLISTTKQ